MKQQTTQQHSTTSFRSFSEARILRQIPMNTSQSAIWTACTQGDQRIHSAYTSSISLLLEGNLDLPVLQDAIQKVIEKYEILRATLSTDGRTMNIMENTAIHLARQDFSYLNPTQKETAIAAYISKESHTVFSLKNGPLVRFSLLKRAAWEYQLIGTIHQIICDDQFLVQLFEELGAYYSAKVQHKPAKVLPLQALSPYVQKEQQCSKSKECTTTQPLSTPRTFTYDPLDVKEVVMTHSENMRKELLPSDNAAYLQLNDTATSYPKLPLHELLIQTAQNMGVKQAIRYNDTQISYEDLEKKVHQFTHFLIAQGVQKGDCVAVALPRSIDLVVGLIAILKCGAAYLPLDPSYPESRLRYMIEDSEAKYLIAEDGFSLASTTKATTVFLEDIISTLSQFPFSPIAIPVGIHDLAYIMYTSGSTGNPKGVMITHQNLVNFLWSMMAKPGITEEDKLLSITTISFDIAGLELFLPLLKGATVIVVDSETAQDSRLLLEVLMREDFTILQATPTSWQMLLDVGWEEKLPIKALCGGEGLPKGLAMKIVDRVDELWNVYGPTETTVWSAAKRITKDDELITIGKPIANTQFYIVNDQNLLAPLDTVGELCIAGDGVSPGYWKRKDLTDEKFIKNPFDIENNPVLYRTGDVGKLLPSGEIQCLGRIDHQVKIRGHRIELSEIEQVLHLVEAIQSAVVIVKNENLIAYVTSTRLALLPEATTNQWKKTLSETLPSHMIPKQFILLKTFPTTLNGKIDRKSLQDRLLNILTNTTFSAPQTASEHLIAEIWQDCLQRKEIDIHSDFFELGGHSLVAVKVMLRIEKQTGNRLPLAALIEYPTIHQLAEYLNKKIVSWDSLVPIQPKGDKNPLFIVHGANYNVMIFKKLAEHLSPNQPVYGLQAKGLDGETTPHSSVEEMAAHYIAEIIRIHPDGPYTLAGFSFGGIIAFEMAKQLKAKGKKVSTIALFDSYVYPWFYHAHPLRKKVAAKLYNCAQLAFTIATMFQSVDHFKRRLEMIRVTLTGWYLRLRYGREKQHQKQFSYSLEIDKKHQLAFKNYHLLPQDVAVDLFRATTNIFYAHDYTYLGWKKIARKGIRKHMVEGDHSEMFTTPAVESFGRTLQHVLDHANSAYSAKQTSRP